MVDTLFKEEVVYSQDDCKFTKQSYKAIRETIRENHAVGFLAGYYDEKLTIASVSGFFLYDLGYTYDEFMEATEGSLFNLFYGENTTFLQPGRFEKIKGSGEGQLLMKGDVPVFVSLYKTDTTNDKQQPMWVLSSRIDWMQQNLQLVNNTIRSGFWYIDCDEHGEMKSIRYSHEFRRMLGYHDTLDFPNVLESWLSAIHPNDRKNTLGQMKEALADRTNTKKYSVEYRMRMKNGEYQWFRNIADITRTLDGTAYHMAGIFVNIEEELEQKRQNQRSEAFHRAYTESNICEYYLDLERNHFDALKVSDPFLEIFEKNRTWDELIHAYREQFVCEEDRQATDMFYNRTYIKERFVEGKGELSLECKIKIDGKTRWVRNIIIRDEMATDFNYAMVFVRDITSAKAEAENIQELTKKNKVMDMLIQGMIKLVDRYVLCDFEKESYQFYSRFECDDYPPEGAYSEFATSIARRYKTVSEKVSIERAFSIEYIRKMLPTADDIYKFEYSTLDEKQFKVVSVLPVLWKNGQPAKVLFIIQNTTQEKLVEMESRKMLKDACEAANKANRAKTEFLSNMSHDIRTPMNAIVGMTAIAENSMDEPERVRGCLERITQSSKHLLNLINEILDMSRIENGKSLLAEEEIYLPNVLDEIVSMTATSAQLHNHEFIVDIQNFSHKYVYGDALKIHQMLFNITSNAVKYTPDGGRICFTAEELPIRSSDTGCYQFTVEDNGIGMSEEFQKVIFDPFARAEDEHTSKVQGTGLGTAIANSYAAMMNGTIEVESEMSKGSKFTITIFLKLKDEEKSEEKGSVLKGNWRDIKQCDFSGKRILLVEDNELNSEIAKTLIEMTNARVDVAENGRTALEMLLDKPETYYHLIFMDIQMPEMNGYEVTRAIRQLDYGYAKTVPIVAMSANAFAEDIFKAKQSGMNDHIAKPLDLNRLVGILEKWLDI